MFYYVLTIIQPFQPLPTGSHHVPILSDHISSRSDQVPDLKEKCLLTNGKTSKQKCSKLFHILSFTDIKDYWYVSQGKLTVPSIDDKEDMQFADEAFDILGFSQQMKYDVFK